MNQYTCLNARLVADPETREFGETKLAEFRIADNPMIKTDKKTGKEIPARFVTCKVWGKQAEYAARLAKGDVIAITGELGVETYTNKQGIEVSKDVLRVQTYAVHSSKTYFDKEAEFKTGQIPF